MFIAVCQPELNLYTAQKQWVTSFTVWFVSDDIIYWVIISGGIFEIRAAVSFSTV